MLCIGCVEEEENLLGPPVRDEEEDNLLGPPLLDEEEENLLGPPLADDENVPVSPPHTFELNEENINSSLYRLTN